MFPTLYTTGLYYTLYFIWFIVLYITFSLYSTYYTMYLTFVYSMYYTVFITLMYCALITLICIITVPYFAFYVGAACSYSPLHRRPFIYSITTYFITIKVTSYTIFIITVPYSL